MTKFLTLAVASALASYPLVAQATAPAGSLLDHLIGQWVLEGPMAGKQVVHDVSFEWVLNKEYVRMHEVSRERTAAGTPAYEAIVYVYHDAKLHTYACLWLDNTGSSPFDPQGVGHAVAAADSIPFLFRYSDTDRFHNTFVYHRGDDSWQWHMDNDHAGALKMFARVTLKRRR